MSYHNSSMCSLWFCVLFTEEEDFDDRCLELMGKKENMFNKFELLTYKEAMVSFSFSDAKLG